MCTYGTIYCGGYSSINISPTSATIPNIGGSQTFTVTGNYYDGTTPNVTGQATFSSSNSSVVSASGSQTIAKGVGTATVTASASLPLSGSYSGYNPTCATLQINQNFTAQASVKVTPTVTIQVEQDKQRGAGGFVLLGQSQTTTNLTANGNPTGGQFSWSVGPNLSFQGPSNQQNATVVGTSSSSSYGDTYVSVTYTYNSVPTTASIRMSVLYPKQFITTTLGGPLVTTSNSKGYLTSITYYAYDQFGGELQVGNIGFTEHIFNSSFNEPITQSPPNNGTASGSSSSSGQFFDFLSITGTINSSFSGTANQTFTLSGYALQPTNTLTYGPTYAKTSVGTFSH